jgi:hypothetical protein
MVMLPQPVRKDPQRQERKPYLFQQCTSPSQRGICGTLSVKPLIIEHLRRRPRQHMSQALPNGCIMKLYCDTAILLTHTLES